MANEINNALDYVLDNHNYYLTNPEQVALWVCSKWFLSRTIDYRTAIINYFTSTQEYDGAWSGTHSRMFTTHRVLLAYYMLNATPAQSLDAFFSKYDTRDEAKEYMEQGDARNIYHIIFAWVAYYHEYPPWMNDFFSGVETDPSWTNSPDFHKTTHILYSYVIARRQFPNLDGIIDAILGSQMPNGKWDGTQYDWYWSHGDVYFTSIQITLLNEIMTLYPNYRTSEIEASLVKARTWIAGVYHTFYWEGRTCGYFGDVTNIESALLCGILSAGQTGIIAANVDMTFQELYLTINPTPSPTPTPTPPPRWRWRW